MQIDYSKLLLKIRVSMNLSQEALAERLNVSFATINRWENEQYEATRRHIQQILDLCDEVGIRIKEHIWII